MSFFRSETMAYYQLVIPREVAWDVFNEAGKLALIQVVDMTPDEPHVSRPFYPMIKRADEVLSKLSTLENEMKKFRIRNLTTPQHGVFLDQLTQFSKDINQAEDKWFEVIEGTLEEKYTQLNEQLQVLDQLQIRKNSLFENKAVLQRSKEVLGATYYQKAADAKQQSYNLNYLVGVVDQLDATRFKRMVFRASKGNAWIVMSDIEYSKLDTKLEVDHKQVDEIVKVVNMRTVFVIVYSGNENLKVKLNKICDSFSCSKFQLPDDPTTLLNNMTSIDHQIDEIDNILRLTQSKIKELLLEYAQVQPTLKVSLLEMSKLIMIKEKTIYHNLNSLYLKHSIYTGFFWAPKASESELNHMMRELSIKKGNTAVGQLIELVPQKKMIVPTYFKINDFNQSFQEIVNTYGIPRYKEVNPGMFAVMFFPFMFGVMFGDIGHGGLLFIGAFLLVQNYDTLKKNVDLTALLSARYLFLLMGLCAVYCGLIYNDFMSLTWNIFGSCYTRVSEGSAETERIEGCIYPIGFDPTWYIASNELNFFNSFKMKFAIIFGVSQMLFGILLKGANNIYYKNYLEFICEFIPQFIFLSVTFGYMSLLIILKWAQSWDGKTELAPSIINMMINIPLKAGSTDGFPLYDQETQESIQYNILILSFICVPWMLIPKPIIEMLMHKYHNDADDNQELQPINNDDPQSLIVTSQTRFKDKSQSLAEELRQQLIRKQKEKERKRLLLQSRRQVSQMDESIIDSSNQLDGADKAPLLTQSRSNNTQGPNSQTKVGTKQQEEQVPLLTKGKQEHEEEFDIGEVFVHQIIETIEFVLGAISNTASYLRLWALSLAHGQLAKVFFEKCLGSGIEDGNVFILVIGWPIFLHCTVGVLMCMDLMECFLHALRLQWVEFQTKFYKADGIKFNPLSFKTALEQAAKEA